MDHIVTVPRVGRSYVAKQTNGQLWLTSDNMQSVIWNVQVGTKRLLRVTQRANATQGLIKARTSPRLLMIIRNTSVKSLPLSADVISTSKESVQTTHAPIL
jgi:hypothetical protein